MKIIRKAGATSNILQIFIADSSSTTGAGLTGLVYNTASLTAYYHKDGDTTATAITLVTMTVGTFTSSGFKEIDATNMPGWYQFCPPDAAFSAGKSTAFHLKGAANMAPLPIEVDLDAQVDVTHLLGTAVSTPATAGILDVNVKNIDNDAASASGTVTFPNAILASTTNITAAAGCAVSSIGNNVITAASINADAITDAKVASDVTIASVTGAVGSVAGAVGSVTGSVGSIATGGITAASFAAGAIDAAAIAADAIGSSELAASAITEIQAGLSTLDAAGVRTAVGLASANLDTQLTAIDDYLDTEVAAIKAKTDNLPSDPADASDVAAAFSTVNSTLSTIAGYVDTEVAAIKAKTDLIPAAPAAVGDIPTAAAIADAVWDEATSGHATAGTTGKALTDAGSAGDPWATALPGAYSAGTAGKIVGDNINATVSSRASQTTLDTLDDYVDTEVAAIKAKTDLIPAAPAAVGDIPTANQNADALLDRAAGIETGYTLRQSMRIMLSSLAGKLSGAATTTVAIRDVGDSKNRITASVDADGNRSAVTLDAT
jgi:hypothetical protein